MGEAWLCLGSSALGATAGGNKEEASGAAEVDNGQWAGAHSTGPNCRVRRAQVSTVHGTERVHSETILSSNSAVISQKNLGNKPKFSMIH